MSSLNPSKKARLEREKKLLKNKSVKAVLTRLTHEAKQTLGELNFFQDVNMMFSCKILELPDRANQNSISRISAGKYSCVLRWSEKYKWHYHILDVPGRSYILIHFGNYYTNTRGCLIAGAGFHDINKDGFRDVTSSKKTMKRMIDIVPDKFELTIIDL